LKPKWNFIEALFHDRAAVDDKVLTAPLEQLESTFQELREQRKALEVKGQYQVAKPSLDNERVAGQVLLKIRNRVGNFVRTIEITYLERVLKFGENQQRQVNCCCHEQKSLSN
jgi:uncharacterized protein YaaN involved in tellurite resistance